MARRKRRRRRVRHPGVYVEEVSSGSRPIEAVGTSTAAFLGSVTSFPRTHPALFAVALLGLGLGLAAVASSTLRRSASSFG
ncbi:hypothetical protein [Oryzobacter terrae]|uniref:hypothetical protein n=1 Tax=Oryzobacter terrae TaxID=1620385 RepID=UPI00366FEA18